MRHGLSKSFSLITKLTSNTASWNMRQIIISNSDSSKLGKFEVVTDEKFFDTMKANPDRRCNLKSKRFRSAFTTEQTNYLENAYQRFPYVDKEERERLSTILKIGERPIKIWFQNRRMKEKRENHKEFDHEMRANVQKFGQDNLYDVPVLPPTNDNRINSLPILPLTADTTINTDTTEANNNVDSSTQEPTRKKETKTLKTQAVEQNVSRQNANFYKEVKNMEQEKHSSPYFYQEPSFDSILVSTDVKKKKKLLSQEYDTTTSAEFSIDLCKKYKKITSTNIAAAGSNVHDDHKKIKEQKQVQKNETNYTCFPKDLPLKKKTRISNPPPPPPPTPTQSDMNKPVYYPCIPNMYAPPYVAPDGVLWKPVNFMPVLATNGPATTIGSQPSPALEPNKTCTCNCHVNSQRMPISLPPSFQNPYAQYLITVPLPHTSSNF